VVEAALVLPVFILFIFALFAFSHVQMVSNLLKSSCRSAARYGATDGITNGQAVAVLRNKMASVMNPNDVTVLVKNAQVFDIPNGNLPETAAQFAAMPNINLAAAKRRQLFLVRGVINYNDVAILRLPWTENITLTGQTIMRHE
jgi:Flp pilus assembly protein TadG